jgi:hypothetical protein
LKNSEDISHLGLVIFLRGWGYLQIMPPERDSGAVPDYLARIVYRIESDAIANDWKIIGQEMLKTHRDR